MSILENILKKVVLQKSIISQKTQISDSVYHLQLKSESIKKDKICSYSVWNINKTEGTLDLAIATESHGIGAQWVVNCQVGTTVYFKWKKGTFVLDKTADSYLMIGDLSALSHLYIINRYLPNNKQVESLIYSSNINQFFKDIDANTPFNFYELVPNAISDILRLVKEITPKMKGTKMVYIAGDSRDCIALNQYFRKELNWNIQQIKTKPFWNPDKKGLE